MKPIDRSAEVTKRALDKDDIRKLNLTSVTGYMQAIISCIVTFIFYIIADTNEVQSWIKVAIILFGCLATAISVYMALNSKKSISTGEKTVTKGYIWDVVEEFETHVTGGKNFKASGTRKYLFKVGDIEHCFYKYAHSYKFSHQDSKYHRKQDKYKVGDLISMHHSLSGELIRISVEKKGRVINDNNHSIHLITHIKHKVIGNREILNYHPREVNLQQYHTEECFYFHFNDDLYTVSKDTFMKYPAQTPIKILKDEDENLTERIFLQNSDESWERLEIV